VADDSSPQSGAAGTGNVFGFIGALLGALVCFIGCAAEAAALGRPHKAPTAVLAAVAIGFGVGSVVLVRVAIHLEHRARSTQPAARAAAPVTVSRVARHPKNGPVSRIVATLAIIGVIAFIVVVSLNLHSQASRSSYTQHHGLARTATVAEVKKVNHYSRYDSWTTDDYDVSLAVPAAAATSTVVHDPTRDFQEFDQGASIQILVDGRQLNYAELPGEPVQSSRWFAGPLVLGVIFGGFGAVIIVEDIKHRRLKRAAALPGGQ
jgi:hypothetical protein